MASLIKQGKVWYVKYYPVRNGKSKWVKGYTDKAKTQQLANKLENEKIAIERGDVDPQADHLRSERARPIAYHVELYKSALTAGGNSTNHVRYTVKDVGLFVAHSGVTHATSVTRPQVDAWKLSLMEAGKDSRSTINRRVGSVQSFLKWLHGQRVLTEYVLNRYGKLKTKGHEKRKRRALQADEAAKLLGETTPAERRELYAFALKTLARWSQIASLTVDGVNFTAQTITFRTKDNRHRNRMHTIPMHEDLVRLFKPRCEGKGREELVWTMPRREDAAKLVRGDCAAAGVDSTHVDFHALRHTGITRLAEMNVHPAKVQRLAGHADIATTLGFYTHFSSADEAAAVAML